MPSLFPGMDPFIEGQCWEDFHSRLIPALSDAFVPLVRPHYIVQIEERVYLEHSLAERAPYIHPDVFVVEPEGARSRESTGTTATVAAGVEILTLPLPERRREPYLTLRDQKSRTVITVVEVLSPTNKRRGSDGRREYLRKRDSVLESNAHLVELDLLRAGDRLPTVESLPPADYYVFVSREQHRPKVEVHHWTLRSPLPTLQVPLAGDDPDVPLDLQAVLADLYDRAGYDYSLDYQEAVAPPLDDSDAAWVQGILRAR